MENTQGKKHVFRIDKLEGTNIKESFTIRGDRHKRKLAIGGINKKGVG